MLSLPGSSSQLSLSWTHMDRACKGAPDRKSSLCPSIRPAVQSYFEALLLRASTGITEGPEETEQTKIASSFLVPQDLAGCVSGREPPELAGSEMQSDRLAQQTGARPVLDRNLPSCRFWCPPGQTGQPSRAHVPSPLYLCTGCSLWLTSSTPGNLSWFRPGSKHMQDPEVLHLLKVSHCLSPSVSPTRLGVP